MDGSLRYSASFLYEACPSAIQKLHPAENVAIKVCLCLPKLGLARLGSWYNCWGWFQTNKSALVSEISRSVHFRLVTQLKHNHLANIVKRLSAPGFGGAVRQTRLQTCRSENSDSSQFYPYWRISPIKIITRILGVVKKTSIPTSVCRKNTLSYIHKTFGSCRQMYTEGSTTHQRRPLFCPRRSSLVHFTYTTAHLRPQQEYTVCSRQSCTSHAKNVLNSGQYLRTPLHHLRFSPYSGNGCMKHKF